ncbi:MAG: CXXX repeat peptide modification system protein [Lachnotalea sp.]
MSEIVGKINNQESIEIQELNEKKLALESLERIIDITLTSKLQNDYEEVMEKFNSWWDTTSKKYAWKREDNKSWHINFNNNEVSLE